LAISHWISRPRVWSSSPGYQYAGYHFSKRERLTEKVVPLIVISYEQRYEEWVEQDMKGTHGRELIPEELNTASIPLDRVLLQVTGVVYQSIESDLPRLTNSNP